MSEDDLRELFTAVAPPSTLEHRWREAAVFGCVARVVRAPVRLRTLVVAFVAAYCRRRSPGTYGARRHSGGPGRAGLPVFANLAQ